MKVSRERPTKMQAWLRVYEWFIERILRYEVPRLPSWTPLNTQYGQGGDSIMESEATGDSGNPA
jgi:hypothetical protein